MTEMTETRGQNGRFHETRYADERTRALVQAWEDLSWGLPQNVSSFFGLSTMSEHLRTFTTPYDRQPGYDNQAYYLHEAYRHIEGLDGIERIRAMRNTAGLLNLVYKRDIDTMRHTWQEGYVPRCNRLRLRGDNYDIYNHAPAFRFTGDVHMIAGYEGRPLLLAEFDMNPLTDETGDYVPNDPEVPVIVLPSMTEEPRVDRAMAVAHLQALHDSLSPHIVQGFAPELTRLLQQEHEVVAAPPSPQLWRPLQLARAAITYAMSL